VEVCVKNIIGASCAYSIEGEERKMSDEEWNEVGRFSMSFDAYGEIRKFIESACQKMECEDLKKRMSNFEGSIGISGIYSF